MTDFSLLLAGVPIGVRVLFPSTGQFCADYLTDLEPLVHVVIRPEDIDNERARSARHDERRGTALREYSDTYLETLALYRKIAAGLLAHDTLVFHGSVVALNGQAYLFCAPSGTGKTTHTRFWLRMIEGAYVLNGDKPLLRVTDTGVLACGTPWMGKERLGCNETLPLAGLCILERDRTNHIERVSLHEALPALIQQAHRPDEPELMPTIVSLTGRIGAAVPLYRMGCTLDERAALVSHAAMAGGSDR